MKARIFSLLALMLLLCGTIKAQSATTIAGGSVWIDQYGTFSYMPQGGSMSLISGQVLPEIRGTWYFVDPVSGDSSKNGRTPGTAVNRLDTAYARCVDGAGDGICILSRFTGTSASTTCYLKAPIVWSKNGITVIGVCAPTNVFQRARIANKEVASTSVSIVVTTTHTITRATGSFITDGWLVGMTGQFNAANTNASATFTVVTVSATVITCSETLTNVTAETHTLTSYDAQLITVSGANNSFYNISLFNGSTQPAALGGLVVTGARNYFGNVHVFGGGVTTPTANERSLELGTGAQDNRFSGCTFGSDTYNRGNNANCELYLNASTADGRDEFDRCLFLAWADGGTAHGAIKSGAATAMGRNIIMRDCVFESYQSNHGTGQANMFIGTNLNTANIYVLGNSALAGYQAWGASSNTCIYTSMPTSAASAGGGIPTTK